MVQNDEIRTAAGLTNLLKALVQETIEGEDEYESRGLMGARVIREGETEPPAFLIEMPNGQRFQVTVRVIDGVDKVAN